MRVGWAVITAAIAAACASGPPLRERFTALEGQPVSRITSRLGAPASEQLVGAERWFAWDWRELGNFGSAGYATLQCRLSARVDAEGTIQQAVPAGNVGGCERLERQLR